MVHVTVETAPKIVSCDDHVVEHPNVWTDRLSKTKWGNRIPHLEDIDGSHSWVIDNRRIPLNELPIETSALEHDGRQQRWEVLGRAMYSPQDRLELMDAEGIGYSVLYPTVGGLAGESFGRLRDPQLELACVQAYNDWLVEEWSTISPRFVPLCIVPLYPVESAVKELRRAVSNGHKGLVYPALPMFLRDVPEIEDREYRALWAACEELGVAVSFHSGCTQDIQAPAYAGAPPAVRDSIHAITRPFSSALFLSNFLLSRIFVPHPRLRVVFSESTVSWGTFILETMDYLVKVDRLNVDVYEEMPSAVFIRQCYVTGGYEQFRPAAGGQGLPSENILWASHFPMANSTWPNSKELIRHAVRGLQESEARQVLWENAANLYKLTELKPHRQNTAEVNHANA